MNRLLLLIGDGRDVVSTGAGERERGDQALDAVHDALCYKPFAAATQGHGPPLPEAVFARQIATCYLSKVTIARDPFDIRLSAFVDRARIDCDKLFEYFCPRAARES